MSDHDWKKCQAEFDRLENAVDRISRERDRYKEALEKIVEINEHPRSCLQMSGLKCDCGISIAQSALAQKGEEK